MTVIEVKSRRDKIARAEQQIQRISDYIDYGYVATDRLLEHWGEPAIGLLHVGETVKTIARAKRFAGRPSIESFFALQRRCLLRFLGEGSNSRLLKYDVAERVRLMGSEASIRRCLKRIVTCARNCKTDCPIWRFVIKNGLKPFPTSFSESCF